MEVEHPTEFVGKCPACGMGLCARVFTAGVRCPCGEADFAPDLGKDAAEREQRLSRAVAEASRLLMQAAMWEDDPYCQEPLHSAARELEAAFKEARRND